MGKSKLTFRLPVKRRMQWSPAQPWVLQTPLLVKIESRGGCSEIWTALSPNDLLLSSGPRSQLCLPPLVPVFKSTAAVSLTSLPTPNPNPHPLISVACDLVWSLVKIPFHMDSIPRWQLSAMHWLALLATKLCPPTLSQGIYCLAGHKMPVGCGKQCHYSTLVRTACLCREEKQ